MIFNVRTLQSTKSKGRPIKRTEENKNLVERETKRKRTLSSKGLSEYLFEEFQISISETTIFRIRKELKFKYSPPKKRPSLTYQQKLKRLQFARKHIRLRTNWKRVVFTDETWFYLSGDRGYLWRQWGENNDMFILSIL